MADLDLYFGNFEAIEEGRCLVGELRVLIQVVPDTSAGEGGYLAIAEVSDTAKDLLIL